MSTLAYAAMTHTRSIAQPGATINPASPSKITTYVDALAALVPAEVLAAHATILTFTTATQNSTVTITQPQALITAFYGLIALSIILYAAGRLMTGTWDTLDYLRALIPPLAFVGWTMLQKATAFDAVVGDYMNQATRNVVALIGGIVLGVIAAALAYKADAQKP